MQKAGLITLGDKNGWRGELLGANKDQNDLPAEREGHEAHGIVERMTLLGHGVKDRCRLSEVEKSC